LVSRRLAAPRDLPSFPTRRSSDLLGLGLDEIEKGLATLRHLAGRFGRGAGPGLAPRNLLDLTDGPKGSGRAAFQGSLDEVVSDRSEEHTSELQSLAYLVCRLLLEK